MSISEVVSRLAHGGPAPTRSSGCTGPSASVPEIDVVQLTLHSDGIWQVLPSPQSATVVAHRPRRPALLASPFYASTTSLYVPPGRLQTRAPARGVVLDIYA